jgi:hypothetical protein
VLAGDGPSGARNSLLSVYAVNCGHIIADLMLTGFCGVD